MKRKSVLILILTFLIISIVVAAFLLSSIKPKYEKYNGVIQKINSDSYKQYYPDIYKNYIVWEDFRNDNLPPSEGDVIRYTDEERNVDIYCYDLVMKKEIQLTKNKSCQESPIIYEDKVIYLDFRFGNYSIFMYNITNNEETLIFKGADKRLWSDIYGDNIIWTFNDCLYVKNLKTNITKLIVDENVIGPRIYKNYIVWSERDSDNLDAYLYDIFTNKTRRLSYGNDKEVVFGVYGDKIIWTTENPNSDVFLYNITNNKTVQITFDANEQWGADISNEYIVWIENRDTDTARGNYDIVAYGLKNSSGIVLSNTKYAYSPAVYNNEVVWESGGDIYYTEIR